ncbi:MAG: rod shape-determining protein RodA [Parcubacteria group bacterium RIFCSPHIGHO2_01_FULL_56_18]|nr:MAG: rod shape-determining protein RodA [Parcubacteria group bacterium RIFCSPHIGHO2_01_FULL_56_18]
MSSYGLSRRFFAHIDWYLFFAALGISILGLVTMYPLGGGGESFFDRQIIWIGLSLIVFFLAALPEYRFLRRTQIVTALYVLILSLLALIFLTGTIVKGAQQRFDLGFFAIQPSDPAKLILIIVLAKYFARRHVEIANFKHIFVSGAYAAAICLLVFLQPDFGGAIIILSIWFGMVLVAGISWKHLAFLIVSGVIVAGSLWMFVLQDYQKDRVLTFIHPLADIHGAGYNAYQSTVAVGSGELLGKGIGFGTQSKLRFLPEYQTDFIFAAFAEEWGFLGVLIVLGLYAVVVTRTLAIAGHGSDNFAVLFGVGVALMFLAHIVVHIGMNLGLLPVTGTTIPFMSYGGSHLLTEFLALGILMGLRRAERPLSREKELSGV